MGYYMVEWQNGDWEEPTDQFLVEMDETQAAALKVLLWDKDIELDGELDPVITNVTDQAVSYEFFEQEYLQPILRIEMEDPK